MSTNPHDTHFAGFAAALFQEMQADLTALFVALGNRREQDITSAEQIIQQLIAQRAYDLAMHVINNLSSYDYDVEPYKAQLINRVPDMPALPEVQE